MTQGKCEYEQMKKEMKYIVKDGVWYKMIFFDSENNVCKIRETRNSHKKSTEQNTKTYEEARKMCNIEIVEGVTTPDQYFLAKIQGKDIDLVRCIEDRQLINYLTEQTEKCTEVIDKLIEFVKTGDKYRIRKTAFEVLSLIDKDKYSELEQYVGTPEPKVRNKVELASTEIKERNYNNLSPLYKENALVVYLQLGKRYKFNHENIKCSQFVTTWEELVGRIVEHETIVRAFSFAKHELDGKSEDEIREIRNDYTIFESREVPEYLKRIAQDKNVVVQLAVNTDKRLSGFDVMVNESRYMSYRLNFVPFGLSEKATKELLESLPTLSELVKKENEFMNELKSESVSNQHKRKIAKKYKASYATHNFKVFMNKFTIYDCRSKELTLDCVNLCNRVGINNISNEKPIKYAFCAGSGKRQQTIKRVKARKKGNIKAAKKRGRK